MPATRLNDSVAEHTPVVTLGVCATCDPRLPEEDHARARNVVKMTADIVAGRVAMPDGTPVRVVYSPILINGERDADRVAQQFKAEGVDAIVVCPDTWAFPQLSLMSLLSHFPKEMPLNITCGNSGPRPGVVFAHAVNGALAQMGRMTALNVGTWDDTGQSPVMTESTATALVDWCYAALTHAGLKGKRVVVFGHDSMGMETALSHVIPTRNTFGLEIARLDMKLLSDMLEKGAYDAEELRAMRGWIDTHFAGRLALPNEQASGQFDKGLALYLIMRDLMSDLNAVGGGFMNQLEWGSDSRAICQPICDTAESLFNSTFDHNGPKSAIPFATEADMQGLLTMLFSTWLSQGNPPLFMDFRKVWEPWEIQAKADAMGIAYGPDQVWANRGFVDGNNSGSASWNWASAPGATPEECMANIALPYADEFYFPGGGNSCQFTTPGGIAGIAGRLAYSSQTGLFTLLWDEATSIDMPEELAETVAQTSSYCWPHTFVTPKYATMAEYKQFAPANHFHMTWDLPVSRLQHWMDLSGVLSATPWQARPAFIEGTDRPEPLLYTINGGELQTKLMRAK